MGDSQRSLPEVATSHNLSHLRVILVIYQQFNALFAVFNGSHCMILANLTGARLSEVYARLCV